VSSVALGPLAGLLDDPAVTDVFVNGPRGVWVERSGRLEQVPLELDESMVRVWWKG